MDVRMFTVGPVAENAYIFRRDGSDRALIVDPGDEAIFLDPYFVMYKHLLTIAGGKSVIVDSYPNFRFPAEPWRERFPRLAERKRQPAGSVPGALAQRAIHSGCRLAKPL